MRRTLHLATNLNCAFARNRTASAPDVLTVSLSAATPALARAAAIQTRQLETQCRGFGRPLADNRRKEVRCGRTEDQNIERRIHPWADDDGWLLAS